MTERSHAGCARTTSRMSGAVDTLGAEVGPHQLAAAGREVDVTPRSAQTQTPMAPTTATAEMKSWNDTMPPSTRGG